MLSLGCRFGKQCQIPAANAGLGGGKCFERGLWERMNHPLPRETGAATAISKLASAAVTALCCETQNFQLQPQKVPQTEQTTSTANPKSIKAFHLAHLGNLRTQSQSQQGHFAPGACRESTTLDEVCRKHSWLAINASLRNYSCYHENGNWFGIKKKKV